MPTKPMAAIEMSSNPALTSLLKSGSDENLGRLAHAVKILQAPKINKLLLLCSKRNEKEGENLLAFVSHLGLKSVCCMIRKT
jgi:hypothetical protein